MAATFGLDTINSAANLITWPQAWEVVALADVYDAIGWIINIVLSLVSKDCQVGVTHHWEYKCRLGPHVALAHALEEQVEVEALIGTTNVEAVLIAWQAVTNHLKVTMVLGSAFATVDYTVAVEVLVLDVTRAKHEVIALEAGLVGYARSIDPRAVGILAGEIGFGEVAVGLKSPDVAPSLAFVSVTGVERMADFPFCTVPFGNLHLAVANAEVSIETKVAVELLTPADLTASFERFFIPNSLPAAPFVRYSKISEPPIRPHP